MTYLIAAYVVVFLVLIAYVISLARRQSNLRRELEALRRHGDKETR
jgi:CcmD family protein